MLPNKIQFNSIRRNPMADLTTSNDMSRLPTTQRTIMFDFLFHVVGFRVMLLGGASIYSSSFVGCSVDESYLFLASCRNLTVVRCRRTS